MSTSSTPIPAAISKLINPATTIAIPLYLCPIDDGGGYKIGINATLTDPNSHATTGPQMYELDTGGEGFWAYPPKNTITPSSSDPIISINYVSGIGYTAAAMPLNVSFPDADQPLSALITVGLITSYTKTEMPIYQYKGQYGFMGDFGASLQPIDVNTPPNQPGILTVLSQLPNYNDGFMIWLKQYPDTPITKPTAWGYLLVGLPDFPAGTFIPQFSMPTPPGSWESFPTYPESLLTGGIQVNGVTQTTGPIDIILDTGTPTTHLYGGLNLNNSAEPQDGDQFQLLSNSANIPVLDFKAGDIPGKNKVDFATNSHSENGSCNTGLNVYFGNLIIYDLASSKLGIFPLAG